MQGEASLLNVLTIPPGATITSPRIVIDGVRGAIFMYQAGGPVGALKIVWAISNGTDPYGNAYSLGFNNFTLKNEDSSSPANVTASGVGNPGTILTSFNFSPPANSVLVAMLGLEDSTGGQVISISDSAGGTWTQQVSDAVSGRQATVWTRPVVAAPGSISVSISNTNASGTSSAILAIKVINFASPTQNGANATNDVASLKCDGNLVTTKAGSIPYMAGAFALGGGTLAAEVGTTTLGSFLDPTSITLLAGRATNPTSSLPGSTQFGWTGASGTPFSSPWAAYEVV